MGRTRDVSKILTSNTSILTLASASATYAPVAAGGLVLLGTTVVTAQSAASLNNIFTSTYDKYMIGLTWSTSTNANVRFRFRESGSDITTGYMGAGWEYNYAGGSGILNARNNGSDGDIGQANTTLSNTAFGIVTSEKGIGGTGLTSFMGQTHAAATPNQFAYTSANGSADGISFYPISGTITCFITVWGMKR